MKLLLAFLVVLTTTRTLVVSGVPISVTRNLQDDFNDFLALVPSEQIEELFYQYVAEDPDFGEALDYVMSDEFKSLVIEVESMTEVKESLKFLHESGLDVYTVINQVNDFLGIEHIKPVLRSSRMTGGLPGFVEDVMALLPLEKIEQLYKEKLQSSPDFITLVKRLQSKEFQGLVNKLMANPALQNLIKRAEAKGVDVQAIFDLLTTLLGLKFPSHPVTLSALSRKEEEVIDILHEIWSKVPMDDIIDLVIDYLVEDEDFRKVVKFMLSEDFKVILVDIEEISEVKALLKYLHQNKLDVYSWLNNLHDLIGLDKVLPLRSNVRKVTGTVPGFIKDVRALLPLEDLYKYYDEKLESSPKFKEFVNRLKNSELQNAVNALNKHNGFNTLLNRLEALGVDWNAAIEVIGAIIGIRFPERPVHILY